MFVRVSGGKLKPNCFMMVQSELAFIVIGILNYAALFLVFITIQKVSSFVYGTYRTSTVVSTDLSFVNRFISFFRGVE